MQDGCCLGVQRLFEPLLRTAQKGLGYAAFTEQANPADLDASTLSCGLVETLKWQVQETFQRQDPAFVRDVFNSNCVELNGEHCIPRVRLPAVLTRLTGTEVSEQPARDLCQEFGICGPEEAGVNLDELFVLLKRPSRLVGWAKSLPLAELVAAAIPAGSETDPLRRVSRLTEQEIEAMCAAVTHQLRQELRRSADELKNAFEVEERTKNSNTESKFNVVAMACGKIADFHEGVEGRIGTPNMKFLQAMEAEHCGSFDSDTEFTTSNYHVTTTPRNEWQVVVNCDKASADMSHDRVLQSIDDLLEKPTAQQAQLSRAEVLAVVLYTGPMFQVYNSILRRWPPDAFEAQQRGGNLYTTTIFVLVSAIQRIAREVKLPVGTKLFRGLGGDRTLPESFYHADAKGRRGLLEWGFMSTTADKRVALMYSGVREGKPHPMVFEIETGAVDRGAIITEFSQYPGERECLFPPCSFLEPRGVEAVEVTGDGVVCKLSVSLNINLKSETCDRLLHKKKAMHMSNFAFLLRELERDLLVLATSPGAQTRAERDQNAHRFPPQEFAREIVVQCRAMLASHEGVDAESFLDDDFYRSLVSEALEVKEMGKYMFNVWFSSHQDALFVTKKGLKACHREWNMIQEARLATLDGDQRRALQLDLCRSLGLVRSDVMDQNNFNETPLHEAAGSGAKAGSLELLVAARAQVEARTSRGETPLHLAARYGHTEAVEKLVELGAEIEAGNEHGSVPLHNAAWGGHVECIRALQRLGADVNKTNNFGQTPVWVAGLQGRVASITALAELGANLHKRNLRDDRHGCLSPAGVALFYKHQEAVALLTELGAGDVKDQSEEEEEEDSITST